MNDVRTNFPALNQKVGSKDAELIYLDSAATALKPQCVIDVVSDFYAKHGGAAGRGAHSLANFADRLVENTRQKILQFTGASSQTYEAIWTSGATESLNLVAAILELDANDNVILSRAEHHANIVPWQQKCIQTGAKIRYLDVLETGEIDIAALGNLINAQTKVISLTHASNVTGIITNIEAVQEIVKKSGFRPIIVLDACQTAAHIPLEIDKLNVDFVAFSAHKIYGPSGLGVLIGRRCLLESASVYKTGGGAVELVEDNSTSFRGIPAKYEPGSVNSANIAGFSAAMDFLQNIGWKNIISHEQELAAEMLRLRDIPGITLLGSSGNRLGVVSFTANNIHPHDLGEFLNEQGIAVRVGHHCAQLIHRQFKTLASTRASIGIYTTPSEIKALLKSVQQAQQFFT